MEVALKIPNEWTNVPKVSTRTELLELRKKDNLPDISYDLDGDGVVSSKDYYLGKRFDLDKDGKLNSREKANAISAINAGFAEQMVWGCDSSGINRSFRIMQKRGNVILNEEFNDVANTYPEFPNVSGQNKLKSGDFLQSGEKKTKTDIELLRKQEVKLLSKYYEKKLHKEYRMEITDPKSVNSTPDSRNKNPGKDCTYSYQNVPKFKTKKEMQKQKKHQLVISN